MKILMTALLLVSIPPSSPLLLLDADMKKPVLPADGFTAAQYLQGSFPVYASEAEAVIAAADQVVKLMEQEPSCYRIDTVATAHSMFLLTKDCEGGQNFTVTLQTTVDESEATFGLTLVKSEMNRRKAQQKVLDLATYLAR